MRSGLREWMSGHVRITVRGKRFERFLNMAIRQGIRVWNIRRVGTETCSCDLLVQDFFRLRPLLKETGCRVHVQKREGLPFFLLSMRRRAGFYTGVALFCFGLYMLSSFVWQVEVVGTKKLHPQTVAKAAAQLGIKEGVWKVKLSEPGQIQQEMLKLIPQASWIGVSIQGTKAVIQVVEKEEPEKPVPLGPRHLVAKKRAVVHTVLPEVGKKMVSVHQVVDKGQLLISGIIGNEERQRAVAAKGTVKGEVWYISEVSVPTARVHYELTGDKQQLQYLLVGPYALQIWPWKVEPFVHAETFEVRKAPKIADYSLPLGWKTVTHVETKAVKRELSMEEAVALGKQTAREDILRKAGGDAVIHDEKVLHVKRENGKVYLSIHFSVIEEITQEQPIVTLPQPSAPVP
ncbi:sporulation protein YqfD [Brevibacillus composti]|uniref:Sporulation protein YqfD n=1 Tax=Brevibacillus composti TaxID=2796470 RepID=A0A7T5JMK9_9BACL|nr:sporulation protein YqfD [Brevibacillus composti]QQE73080.1 sporulation protein YqfD [Brevibacillus composti]QUO40158.1 sporulation protein YqfD [Brevibacillus composti]